jgi:hypothetical protein
MLGLSALCDNISMVEAASHRIKSWLLSLTGVVVTMDDTIKHVMFPFCGSMAPSPIDRRPTLRHVLDVVMATGMTNKVRTIVERTMYFLLKNLS